MINSLDTCRPHMLPTHSHPHLPRNARVSGSASSTSLICQNELEVDVHGCFDTAHTFSINIGQLPTKGITSQYCMVTYVSPLYRSKTEKQIDIMYRYRLGQQTELMSVY